MTAPERIWTVSTNGKCHVGFDAPSLNYTNEYVRADLAAVQPMQGVWNKCTFDLSGAGYDCVLKDGDARHGDYGEGQKVFWDGTTINADGLYILSKLALDKRIAAAHPAHVRPETTSEHIARDMREVRFPERSEVQMVPDFEASVREMARLRTHVIEKGSRWRHRNGTVYTAYDVVLIEATLTPAVVYSGDGSHHIAWVRPAAEFLDGRFELVTTKGPLDPKPDPRDEVIARLVEALRLMRSTYPYNPPCYGWVEQVEAHKTAKAALAAAKAVHHG